MPLIAVNQDHIKNGIPIDPWCCPVAKALREIYPDDDIAVGSEVICINRVEYDTPKVVREFIKSFDRFGGVVEPFTFEFNK